MGLVMRQSQDSHKVKVNGVQSLGNILRYIPTKSVGKLMLSTQHPSHVKIVTTSRPMAFCPGNVLRYIPAKSVGKLVVK